MSRLLRLLALLAIFACRPALADPPALHQATDEERARYAFLDGTARIRTLDDSFPAPPGFTRVPVTEGSFGAWLRTLPLRAPGTPVRAFDGHTLHDADDPRIAAVAELDVGTRDLQQCADSIIRLHAEYLWARGEEDQIAYKFTTGDVAKWPSYAEGERPKFDARDRPTWRKVAHADRSRKTFHGYLDLVFAYANTQSLDDYTGHVKRAEARAGDFFVLGGSPGHAVLLLDVAVNADGKRVALVGQGYMPAQDFQVLAGPVAGWFSLDGDVLDTPFWKPFPWSALRRL